METNDLYYTAPENKIFEEVKEKSIELWSEKNNEYGYADKKINLIKPITNIQDNMMHIIAMFDITNQLALSIKLSEEAKLAVRDRMIAGKNDPSVIVF